MSGTQHGSGSGRSASGTAPEAVSAGTGAAGSRQAPSRAGSLPTTRTESLTRTKGSFRTSVILILWLVVVWGALWQDFGPGNLLFGLVLAIGVVKLLPLPPVRYSGRFNLLRGLEFVVKFLWWIVQGSFQVFWLAVRPGPVPTNAVVSVRLRTTDDLLMTAVGQVVSLIPGSLVVEVDRRTATIYFHVIDVDDVEQAQRFRDRVFQVEELLIRVMGQQDYLAALREGRLDELMEYEDEGKGN